MADFEFDRMIDTIRKLWIDPYFPIKFNGSIDTIKKLGIEPYFPIYIFSPEVPQK